MKNYKKQNEQRKQLWEMGKALNRFALREDLEVLVLLLHFLHMESL